MKVVRRVLARESRAASGTRWQPVTSLRFRALDL